MDYVYDLEYFSGGDFECSNCNDTVVYEGATAVVTDDNTVQTNGVTHQRGDNVPHTNWILTTLFLVVFTIGMIGNLLVIFVIVILREYKKVRTHWYVLQLAIADTIFLMTIPLRVVEDVGMGDALPQWVCKARETMFFINYYSSVSFLVLMTVDRYVSICKRFSPRLNKFRRRSVTYFNTAVVWIVSLVICVPVMLHSSKVGFAPNCKCDYYASPSITPEKICLKSALPSTNRLVALDQCIKNLERYHSGKCWNIKEIMGVDLNSVALSSKCNYGDRSPAFIILIYFNAVVMFLFPFIIMSLCYATIAVELKRSRIKQCEVSVENSPAQSPLQGRRKRSESTWTIQENRNRIMVTWMCGCLVALFVVCWLPFHALQLAKLRGIRENDEYCDQLFHVAFVIAYISVSSHSILNPCLYNFIGKKSENRLRDATSSMRSIIRGK